MVEKSLSELEWKKFAKGRGIKESPLGKVLAALELARGPAAELQALDEIDRQADLLRRAHRSDRDIVAYLDDLTRAAAKQHRLSDAAAAQEARKTGKTGKDAAPDTADEEDDAGTPLLTTRMVPLLRQAKTGDPLHAMVALAGRNTVVLLARRPIAPTRRKLLTDHLGVAGGVKFIAGDCIWEDGAYTFAVSSRSAGLAKRVWQALLEQTGQRCKVRVRGEDGVMDDDGEDADDPAGTRSDAPAAGASPVPVPAPGPDTKDGQDRVPFDALLERLRGPVDEALRARHPQASRLRAVESFAQGKADAGDITAAMKALVTLEQLLEAPAAGPAVREQALAQWRGQRDATVKMLKALAADIVADADPEARAAVIEVTAVVKQLGGDPATRRQAGDLMAWLENDDVVAEVDELAEPVREPLLQRLRALQASMAG